MILEQKPGVRTRELENGELALMDSDDTHLILLNDVGAAVWDLCDGSLHEEGVVEALSRHFPQVAAGDLARDVGAFLERLRELDTLKKVDPSTPNA